MKKPITQKQYGKIMDKKIEEVKNLPFDKQLIGLLEEADKYKLIKKCDKLLKKCKDRFVHIPEVSPEDVFGKEKTLDDKS